MDQARCNWLVPRLGMGGRVGGGGSTREGCSAGVGFVFVEGDGKGADGIDV